MPTSAATSAILNPFDSKRKPIVSEAVDNLWVGNSQDQSTKAFQASNHVACFDLGFGVSLQATCAPCPAYIARFPLNNLNIVLEPKQMQLEHALFCKQFTMLS